MGPLNHGLAEAGPEAGRPSALRLWAAVAPAMVVPFIAALFYFVLVRGGPTARLLYALSKVFILLWPLWACRILLHERLPRLGRGWSLRLRALPLGALAGLVMVALMLGLLRSPAAAPILAGASNVRLKAQQLGILEWYWPFALFLSVANSLAEEYYWRWFVYGQLRRRMPGWRAHALAGAAFAAHHMVVTTQFFPGAAGLMLGAAVGIGGVIMSLLYERQGTVAGAWLCHLVVDLGIMGIGHGMLF
ncbi:MAG TPA: CPBP family intramembrane glutamic endopeptidase [Thermoanaerobaculia bacterium]|nr:CPBP family intramembrane glutamic endopeptidase [Thermoanaerobaculia bacterium]